MTPTEKNKSENVIDFTAIGQRLRAARTKKGLRITDAIELTGMSSGVISALEIGNRNPGLNSLVTFAKAYDCSLDWIVFGIEPSADSQVSTSDFENGDGSGDSHADNSGAESNCSSAEVENLSTGETDPYYRSLKELTESMDDAEKDFMLRLISTAHSEFAIVRNKMK